MSGDAPHLHRLKLTAGGIPASLEFCRWLAVIVSADAASPHVQGIEPRNAVPCPGTLAD